MMRLHKHLSWMIVGAIVALVGCRAPQGADAQLPYRPLPDLDLRLFACAPNPEYSHFASRTAVMQAIARLATHCPNAPNTALQASFRRSLDQSNIHWERESLIVLSEYYGTGMATAHLDLTLTSPGVMQATIVWKVPPPPVTPDTTVFRTAFLVDRSAINQVIVTGREAQPTIIPITPQEP